MSDTNNSQELTLKEFILLVKDYSKYILSKWWIIILVTALCISVAVYKHITHTIKYPYVLKFMVESESEQPAFGGLLGQFGLGQQSVSPIKVQEVGRSNINFERIVLSKLDDEKIANRIIEWYELDSQWEKRNPDFKQFRFTADTISDDMLDKIALKKLANFTWKGVGNGNEPLITIDYNYDEGIYTIISNTIDPSLSQVLANTVYGYIVNFFETEILENKTKAVALLQSKADSLDLIRGAKNLEIARFDDRSIGIVSKTYQAKRNILQQDLIAISSSYAEVTKNKEIAEFNLFNNKALFLTIDKTLEPILGEKSDLIFKLLLATLAGILLSVIGIIISKFYKAIMNS